MASMSAKIKQVDVTVLDKIGRLGVGEKVKDALYYNNENKTKYNKICQMKFSPLYAFN